MQPDYGGGDGGGGYYGGGGRKGIPTGYAVGGGGSAGMMTDLKQRNPSSFLSPSMYRPKAAGPALTHDGVSGEINGTFVQDKEKSRPLFLNLAVWGIIGRRIRAISRPRAILACSFAVLCILAGAALVLGPQKASHGAGILVGHKDLTSLLEGTSLVVACKDKQSNIVTLMRNWLKVDGIDEIVLVDWSSQPALAGLLKGKLPSMDKVVSIRVENETEWAMSRAYNLGVHFARYENVVRLDCDHAVYNDFVAKHTVSASQSFYAGKEQLAKNINELDLSNAMVVHQQDFWAVGGYDERIQSQGGETENLCDRLTSIQKLTRKDIDYQKLAHLPHRSESGLGPRGPLESKFASDLAAIYNRMLTGTAEPWSSTTRDRSGYCKLASAPGMYQLRATRKAKLPQYKQDEKALNALLDKELHGEYHVPLAYVDAMTIPNKQLLVQSLLRKDDLGGGTKKSKIFFAHTMHGLGNRIRALGSSLAVAKKTNRVLVVVWDLDQHCGASFNELFADKYPVILGLKSQFPFTTDKKKDTTWKGVRVYNYMDTEPGAIKNEEIVDDPTKHIYYKGAFITNAPGLSSWKMDNDELAKLKPSSAVQAIINKMSHINFTNVVSVHIRNRGLETDIKGVDFKKEYTNEGATTMEYWRKKSHYTNFVDKMKEILREDPKVIFYLSSDTVQVLTKMREIFPGKVIVTERNCDDRNGSCAIYALADLYLLARGRYILGSNWSSFTEAAQRLGGLKGLLSGQHFATDTK